MADKVLPNAYAESKNFGVEVNRSFFNLDFKGKRLKIGLEVDAGGEKRFFQLEANQDSGEVIVRAHKLNGDVQEIQGVTWSQIENLVNFETVVNFINNKVSDWKQGNL